MGILFAFPYVESDAERVKQAAGNQKDTGRFGEFGKKGFGNKNDQPSHQKIQTDRPYFCSAAGCNQFEDGAGKRHPPDYAENYPARRAAERHQQKRGLGSGNQVVNGNMVKFFQNFFCSFGRYGMV